MESWDEVYKKVEAAGGYDSLLPGEASLTAEKGRYRAEARENFPEYYLEYFADGRSISHSHPETLEELAEELLYFFEHPGELERSLADERKRARKAELIIGLLMLLLFLLLFLGPRFFR